MKRRKFLQSGIAIAALSGPSFALPAPAPSAIIDTHTHFYDPSRPQGVPWPAKDDGILYRAVLPDEFRRMTAPLGVTGTIVVEASPLLADNDWILDLAGREAKKEKVVFGFAGHLEPGKPAFRDNLERLRRNPLFLGIRVGSAQLKDPDAEFLSNLKALAASGLELDVIGGPPVLDQTVRLTDRLPDLRVVIDHLPFDPPASPSERAAYRTALREIGKRPRIYAKVSNVVRKVEDRVPENVDFYRPALDELWDVFGADRLVYGSNWPVSDHVAPYATLLKIARAYFAEKGPEASEKYFWKNSKAAYRWV